MTKDLISDVLTRIRNAIRAKHSTVIIFFNKIILEILEILKNENFILNYNIESFNPNKCIIILKYYGWWFSKTNFIVIKRISKPGSRIFSSYRNFHKYLSAFNIKTGKAIVSTSHGIMTHVQAKKLKKGGEILFYIE
jgi:small subunit ribosomal protein S8